MDNPFEFIQYEIFKPYESLIAFTTTRQTLSVQNPRFTGDVTESFIPNRLILAKKLGINNEQLVFPRQTHSNCVAEILEIPKNEIGETDALVSNQRNICICVQTADCVPILLFNPIKQVISAVHAGWRGTVSKIVEIAVQKMISNYNSLPENILAAIGPSISKEIYEVGDEVVQAVFDKIPNGKKTLHKNSNSKIHFNLWEGNRQILLKNGLQQKNIEILGDCSFLLSDNYFSARRDGINTGRMVSGIMLLK